MVKARTRKKGATSSKKKELDSLKKKVYQLANVKNTKALKVSDVKFDSLDFRKQESWEIALRHLKEYENFKKNPPEQYRELFDEINQVNKEAKDSLLKSRKTFKKVEKSLKELEALTKETKEDVESINQGTPISIPISLPENNINKVD